MVRPPKQLEALLDDFVCVRVTDMRGVDLERYAFDFDLTFSVLVMDSGGRVLHRYGGRDERGADTWLSVASLIRLLRRSQAEASRDPAAKSSSSPQVPGPRIEEIPSFKKRDRGECIHCHSVNTSLYEQARDAGTLTEDWIWKYPTPARIGVDLDRDEQERITAVRADSPAADAGLRVGDRVLSIGEVPVASATDVMYALERAPGEACRLTVSVQRGLDRREFPLELPAGWKRGSPREFAWRPTKWALTPAPGFGGPRLTPDELASLGLGRDAFAFRVQYLVTWGDNRRYGHAAARAGLREGDVVVALDGRGDFHSIEHFHAWWRLEVDFGQEVTIDILRAGHPMTLRLIAIP